MMVMMSSGPIGCLGPGALVCPESFESYERGRKFSATTALGMTETMRGSRDALRTVFSLLHGGQRGVVETWRLNIPGMADTYDMIHIAKRKLQQLVRKYAASIREAKQTMVCKDGPQPHCTRMQDGLMT